MERYFFLADNFHTSCFYKMDCTSCKQEISPIDEYVKFHCPECDAEIYRCPKCRTFGHEYTCECGFKGP